MNFKQIITSTTLCTLLLTMPAIGASLEKAEMFLLHNLNSEAKKELIEVIFSNQNAMNKAEAYYILGTLAFEENNISASLETWGQLITAFPESEQAKLVKDKINQLSEIVGEESRTNVESAIARFYLRNADFWSESKSKVFRIDGSWIPNIEAAAKWYDKVIDEFPKTRASQRAYEDKMHSLIAKLKALKEEQAEAIKDLASSIRRYPSVYDSNYIKESKADIDKEYETDFNQYIPQLLETFSAFQKDHPEVSSLQAFRYQIAQIYWIKDRNSPATTKWLKLIIEQAGNDDTFYRDLAQRRLNYLDKR